MTDRVSRPQVSRRRVLALSTTAVGGTFLGGTGTVAAREGHEHYDETIESHDGTEIAMTVYRPAGATAGDPVPTILHSHGWSGSRTSGDGAFQRELDRGFGVLSFDQRGHGDSGGQAYSQNPELEGKDVVEVLDYVAGLEWVRRSPGGSGFPKEADPMVFAMGGSYGGAYQLVGAFTETWLAGDTRFDALAPEITWYNLSESLAPRGVTRSAWVSALYAAGASMVPEHIHRSFVYGSTTGQWPTGELPGEPDIDTRFYRNGPSGFVESDEERGTFEDGSEPDERFSDAFVEEEFELDVPVLVGQGMNDNLFNLNQAWHNFERSLGERVRRRSAVVAYNGGHALPEVLPPGQPESNFQDGCSPGGDFGELRLRFFEHVRDNPEGGARALDAIGAAYSLTTADGERCLQLDSLDDRETLASGVDLAVSNDGEGNLAIERVDGADGRIVATGDGFPGDYDPETVEAAFEGVESESGGTVATTTGVGVPVHLELEAGPLTVGGVPTLSADVTAVGIEQRVFFALSVGESPATARVVQNNVLPLREPEPVEGEARTVELPGVAVDVAEGESLFLTLSAVSDMSFGHGSVRTPGTVVLENLTVDVPLVEA